MPTMFFKQLKAMSLLVHSGLTFHLAAVMCRCISGVQFVINVHVVTGVTEFPLSDREGSEKQLFSLVFSYSLRGTKDTTPSVIMLCGSKCGFRGTDTAPVASPLVDPKPNSNMSP